jgi:hypothetical protein
MPPTSDLVRVSSSIMGHPRRDAQVGSLLTRLKGFTPTISYRMMPGEVSLLRSATAAWAAVDPGATHHVVFQDDVVPHPGLYDAITAAVAVQPGAGIAAFCEWGCKTAYAVRLATMAGFGFAVVVDKYVPTNALILPAAAATELAQRLAAAARRGDEPDDTVVKDFADEAGIQCVVTVPNLVDDLGLPSLASHDGMGIRKSACFLADESAGPAASGKTLAGLVVLPFFQWATGRALVLHRAGPAAEWIRDDLAPLLARCGLRPDQAAQMVRVAVSGRDPGAARVLAAAAPWLPHLAQVTVALVLCVSGLTGDINIMDRLQDPVVRAAWRSLVPGALRTLSPACARADIAEGLFAFTVALAGQTEALLADGTLVPLACTEGGGQAWETR